jgi:hypothetical protein
MSLHHSLKYEMGMNVSARAASCKLSTNLMANRAEATV